MEEPAILKLVALLLLAVAVAVLTKRVRVPYTVALVLVGLAAGALWREGRIALSHDLILLVFLPPLLFEGCLNMDLEVLRRNALPVFLLAVPGIVITILALGAIIHLILDVEFLYALLVAAIIAPTDPISVLALFKEVGVGKDLAVIVEGESVFNDGIGVLIFLVLLGAVEAAPEAAPGLGEGSLLLLQQVGIGLGVGVLLGGAAYWVLRWIDDHLIEVVLSLILGYGSFVAAGVLGGSGVISVVAAGLIIGNYGRFLSMSPTTRITLSAFWGVAAFLVNSLVFLLIGIDTDPEKLLDGRFPWSTIAAVFAAALVLRAGICYGLMEISRRLTGRPPLRWTFVIFWGGLRGTVPIALALGITGTLAGVEAEDTRHLVFGVVLLSLVFQGISIRFVLSLLGLGGRSEDERVLEETEGRALAARAAEHELETMRKRGEIPPPLYEELRVDLEAERKRAVEKLRSLVEGRPGLFGARRRHIMTRVLKAQRVALQAASHRGVISEDVLNELTGEIDARLAEGLPDPAEEKGPPMEQ